MAGSNELKQFTQCNININIHWVKGHFGIVGNEMADNMANTGAKLSQMLMFNDNFQFITPLIKRLSHAHVNCQSYYSK